jgi:hypothetical protein
VRKVLRKAEYVIYDRFVDVFSEPRNEPPIQRAQINRLSNGGFFVPVFFAVIRATFSRRFLEQLFRGQKKTVPPEGGTVFPVNC